MQLTSVFSSLANSLLWRQGQEIKCRNITEIQPAVFVHIYLASLSGWLTWVQYLICESTLMLIAVFGASLIVCHYLMCLFKVQFGLNFWIKSSIQIIIYELELNLIAFKLNHQLVDCEWKWIWSICSSIHPSVYLIYLACKMFLQWYT